MGSQRQRFQAFTDRAAQVEWNVFNDQLAGLDFRKIKNVVDHGEQGVSRRFDDTEVLALLIIQLGLQRQLGHAKHTIHGRADLMAHIGQKIGLGTVGQFGAELGTLQLLGNPFGLRNVGEVAVPQHATVQGNLEL